MITGDSYSASIRLRLASIIQDLDLHSSLTANHAFGVDLRSFSAPLPILDAAIDLQLIASASSSLSRREVVQTDFSAKDEDLLHPKEAVCAKGAAKIIKTASITPDSFEGAHLDYN